MQVHSGGCQIEKEDILRPDPSPVSSALLTLDGDNIDDGGPLENFVRRVFLRLRNITPHVMNISWALQQIGFLPVTPGLHPSTQAAFTTG